MKNNADEKTGAFRAVKKARVKFNAVDFIIVFVVTAIIAVLLISVFGTSADSQTVKLEYTVRLENVREDFIDNILYGETVYASSSQVPIGIVSGVDNSERYAVYEYDSRSNAIVGIEYPDKYNLKVTVLADAGFSEGVGYSIGGIRVAVGSKLDLRFANYVGSAYCVEIREAE